MDEFTKRKLKKEVKKVEEVIFNSGLTEDYVIEEVDKELSRRGFDPEMVRTMVEERGGIDAYFDWALKNEQEIQEKWNKLANFDPSSGYMTEEQFISSATYAIVAYLGL